jgi:diguanylate cyclase (GGDEF)-like protein
VTTLTVKQIIIRIAIIVSLVELVVMVCLAYIPHTFGVVLQALIDVIVLVIVSTPLIYIWVIKPFVIARDEALLKLENMAYSDQLTDLPNRRYFTNYMKKIISESVRHKYFGALLLLDLDNFKPVNDKYGHDAGDAVLVEVAKRLLSSVRQGDLVVRLGGDEFVILLNRLGNDASLAGKEALSVAEKLQRLLGEPIEYKNRQLKVGASFGACIFGVEQAELETILKQGDTAMYRAKKNGKGKIVLFE